MFSNFIYTLTHATIGDLLDIILVTIILYSFLRLIKDTKAYQMAIGLGLVGVLVLVAQIGNLYVTQWLIRTFSPILIIAIIILFAPELRRFFTSIGSRSFRNPLTTRAFKEKAEDIFLSVNTMSRKKIGALIALEKNISLKSYADRGTTIEADVSKDLLISIFFPHSPLHDGAVIVRGNRILAAGCLLPLPATHNLGRNFLRRTRHLAAIGLSQETDAAVIVVSEETGAISLATKGRLEQGLELDQLKERLLSYLK
ncbi:MAG: diadenylate cyclase CdaA [Candidatus Aminicenantaceae bacterium]